MEKELLKKLIVKYAIAYYTGNAEVSDEYFDSLIEDLRKIDPNDELLKTPGWGYVPSKKYSHWWDLKIGSLPKVQEGQQVPSQYLRSETRISAKLDGLSVVSYYIDGNRVQCLTRGNGSEGIDVTSKIALISPLTQKGITNIDGSPFTGTVRGEVVMPIEVWDNKYSSLKEENPSANPRNLASGFLNRKEDSPELADLDYVVYKVLYSEGYTYKNLEDQANFFCNNRFDFVACAYFVRQSEWANLYELFSRTYPCDGLVLSNYDGSRWDEIAYKFQAESTTVFVKSVSWSASRTGKLNPIINFDPVELSGAMVQRATGYNAAFIRDNQIGPGAVIEVCRSNEVIPKVLKVLYPSAASLPEFCPNCGNEIHWKGDDLVCEAENESQLSYHFISTLAPLDGAGWSLYRNIVETFGLASLDSLVNWLSCLRKSSLEETMDYVRLQGLIVGQVTTEKVKEILKELLDKVDVVRFIAACNIPGVSYTTAQSILKEDPKTFLRFIKESQDDLDSLLKIKGIGMSVITNLRKFAERVQRLASVVEFDKASLEKDDIEVQFKVAITGSLSMKRADFDKELQKRGIVQSGNFKEIKYLITNNPDSGSSKMQNAKKYGVEIISEEDFKNKYFN